MGAVKGTRHQAVHSGIDKEAEKENDLKRIND